MRDKKLVQNLPADVKDALIKRGWKEDDQIDADTAFDEFCNWKGLLGYGPFLRHTMLALRGDRPGVLDEGDQARTI